MRNYVIKGNICYNKTSKEFCIIENGYVVCENGRCAGTYMELPKCYEAFPCYDYENKIIIPGLIDMYVDAALYSVRGLGMNLEFSEWTERYALPEEAKYADFAYAEKAYDIFSEDLRRSAITRACVFGTAHTKSTLILMKKLEMTGLKVRVGQKEDMSSLEELQAGENFENVRLLDSDWAMSMSMKEGLDRQMIASCSLLILKALALRHSRVGQHLYGEPKKNLSVEEMFYKVTEDAGINFGKVGSFERGYEFDAVVLDDSSMDYPEKRSITERLESMVYLAQDIHVVAKFVDGKKIFEK